MQDPALRQFVEQWLRSWTGNRPDELLGYYAADAYYQDPARPGGLRGQQQLKPYFEKLLAANPAWRWEVVELLPTQAGCCLKWKATVPTRAGVAEMFGLDIVEIADGKITRNEVYFDPTPLR